MFILKNAVRNIRRSKGRSILIGIIITIIAFSVCIGLYIRQASADSRDAALAGMKITAQITPNRSKAMKQASGSARRQNHASTAAPQSAAHHTPPPVYYPLQPQTRPP